MDAAEAALERQLQGQITRQAEEYAVAPQNGYAAGYTPEQRYQRSREIGVPSQDLPVRSELSAWMHGIARRDLRGWHWRINEYLGATVLEITGRRR